MKTKTLKLRPLLIGIIAMALIFVVELKREAMVGTVAYIFVVLSMLWISRKSYYLAIPGLAASIFIVGAFVSVLPQEQGNVSSIVNRSLSFLVVWFAVYFTYRYRKLYEEEHQQTEKLKALFENATEGILFTDDKGNITLANPFLEKIFGYQPGELLNKPLQQLILSRDKQYQARQLNGKVFDFPLRTPDQNLWGKHKCGLDFPVEVSVSHFNGNQSKTTLAFVLNATERLRQQQLLDENLIHIRNLNLELAEKVRQRTYELEQANQELKKSQYLYKAMAHHFPDGVIGILDREMKCLLADGKDIDSLGLKEEAVLGDSMFDSLPEAISAQVVESLKLVYKGQRISLDVEFEDKVYNIVSVPIPNAAAEINEILVVIKNITAQKKLEHNLIKNLEKEKELSLLKSRFVTMASHEFRSPLTTILSSAFLLEHYTGEQLEKERKKHLDRIKRSVNALNELLNDFLSLGKLEEGKVKAIYADLELPLFIEDLLQEVTLLKKEDQKFQYDFKGSCIRIKTDKQLLRNILLNLISNAIKYSPASSTIGLAVEVGEQQFSLQVSDQGIGIPQEEQKYIFRRFFRAKNATQIQGTGLGLNIVKKYVKLLHGSIAFSSKAGEGTTFTASFPIV